MIVLSPNGVPFFSDALRIHFRPISKKVVYYYFLKKRWNPQDKKKKQKLIAYSHIFFSFLILFSRCLSLPIAKEYSTPLTISIFKLKFTVISYKGDSDTWVLLLTINRSDKNTFSITDWSLKTGRSWENKNCKIKTN